MLLLLFNTNCMAVFHLVKKKKKKKAGKNFAINNIRQTDRQIDRLIHLTIRVN